MCAVDSLLWRDFILYFVVNYVDFSLWLADCLRVLRSILDIAVAVNVGGLRVQLLQDEVSGG